MRRYAQILMLSAGLAGGSFGAAASQCSREEAFGVPDAASARLLAPSKPHLSQLQTECSIAYAAWQNDLAAQKWVWDVRDASSRARRGIEGVTLMTRQSALSAPVSAGRSVLLVGDAIDLTVAFDMCSSMRARGHRVFVLMGGDREWGARGSDVVRGASASDAELTIESAATWFNDGETRWIAVDGATPLAKVSSQQRVRTIYFRADSLSSAQLRSRFPTSTTLDEQSWWVDATERELERVADQGRRMAASRDVALAKPCGVN